MKLVTLKLETVGSILGKSQIQSNYMRLELLITMYTESLLDLTPFWVFALTALMKLRMILTTF